MKIAILSRSSYIYSTNRLVVEAKKRGHNVIVIDPLKCNLVMEKNEPGIHVVKNKLERVDAIIPRIGYTITDYGSAIIRQFEMMNVFTSLSSNALLRSRDKIRTMQLLSRESIDFPKTFYTNMNTSLEAEEILDFVGGVPVVVKVSEGTQGVGVMLLETKMAAVSVIQAMHSLKAKVMVQEYIEEAEGRDLRVLVVNNKVIGAMERNGKEGDFRSNLHRGGSSKRIRITAEEKRIALKACEAMGLKVAGVDMLRSKRGPLILEINSSPGLEGIEKTTGINIAESIIQFVEHGASIQSKTEINRSEG